MYMSIRLDELQRCTAVHGYNYVSFASGSSNVVSFHATGLRWQGGFFHKFFCELFTVHIAELEAFKRPYNI